MMRFDIVLFLLAIPQIANSARMHARDQLARIRNYQTPKTIEIVKVKKMRHSSWLMTSWDTRYLMLNEYIVDDVPTYKLEYAKSERGHAKTSFDICADKVRVGAAEGYGAGVFQIFTAVGHKNYVFKPTGGSDLKPIFDLTIEKARECNSVEHIIKEGTVMKEGHNKLGFDKKFMTLSTLSRNSEFLLEYISLQKSEAVRWHVCDPSFEVKNGGTNMFTIVSEANPDQGRKHTSYTFRAVGASETEKTLQAKDWIARIEGLQDRCDSDESVVVGDLDIEDVDPEVDIEDSGEKAPKSELVLLDATKDKLSQVKDMIMANVDKIPIHQTLVAFDFDLTLRDDDPEGGIMLRQEETTRQLLEWLKENGAPSIVVTARSPSPATWYRTWRQAREIGLADLLGQFVPPLKEGVKIKEHCKPDSSESSQCDVILFDHGHHKDMKMVEANGMVVAGYNKGEAILAYIENHGLDDIKQIVFADDYVTNSVQVARTCEMSESIERVVGVWFAPFDVKCGTKEFVDEIRATTEKLKECLQAEKFSDCKPKYYAASWCDASVAGYLGDNGYCPLTPDNLYNTAVVLLGKIPITEEEKKIPEAALREAQEEEKEINKMKRLCQDAEEKEKRQAAEAEKKKLLEAGLLPPCTGTVKCMQNKDKPPEKRKCDVNVPACAHLL